MKVRQKLVATDDRRSVQMSNLMVSVILIMWIILCSIVSTTNAQQFELIKPTGAPDVQADFTHLSYSSGAFEDYDGDGDLDYVGSFVPEGWSKRKYFIYDNDGSGNFGPMKEAGFSGYLGITNHPIRSYAFADFDGDDIPDLLSPNNYNSTRLYLGSGSGEFTETSIKLRSTYDGDIIPVDADSDGDMDVFIAGSQQETSGGLEIPRGILYINDGSANFSEAFNVESEFADARIGITDAFDGSKRNMIVSGRFDGAYGTVLYHYDGSGNYNFVSDVIFSDIEGRINEVHSADINGDGIGDFVLESHTQGLRFFMSDGTTNYTILSSSNLDQLGVDDNFSEIIFSDLNGDGFADVVFTTGQNGSAVYLGDGTGNFVLSEQFPETDWVSRYVFGDITGDGFPEFMELGAMTNNDRDPDLIQLFVNDGDGTFTPDFNYLFKEVGGGELHVANFDNDCDNDIFIIGDQYDSNANSDIYLNDGTGLMTNFGTLILDKTTASLVEDLNRDGHLDILIDGKVYENDGNATFTAGSGYPFSSAGNGDILQFLANNDGAADVLVSGDGKTSLYLNKGNGDYETASNTGLIGFDNTALDAGDLDNDGDIDLVMAGLLSDGESATIVFLNNGNGFFTQSSAITLQSVDQGAVRIADIDGDGDQDILLAGSGHQLIYLNEGGSSFELQQSLEGLKYASIEIQDIDYDGDVDFVSSGLSVELDWAVTSIYINDGNGFFTQSGEQLRGVQDASMVFSDLDGDYDNDLILTGREIGSFDIGFVSRAYNNSISQNTINKEVTVCNSYCFIDETLNTSGTYSKVVTTSEGESRTIVLDLVIAPTYDEEVEVTAQGYYIFNGETLRSSGSYQANLTSSLGCDSLVTLNLTITDFVAEEDHDHLLYELIQPEEGPQVPTDFPESRYGGAVIYDMDGDGDDDYLIIGETVDLEARFIGFLKQADGSFLRVEHENITLSDRQSRPTILHGDINGDGIEDLVVSGERTGDDLGTQLYFGDAAGGLTRYDDIDFISSLYGFIDIADLTGDGRKDILIGNYSEGIFLYEYDGSGSFTRTVPAGINIDFFGWDGVISEEYNGNIRDILIADYVSGYKHKLYRHDGTNFTLISTEIFSADFGSRAHFGDVNADDVPDVIVSSSSFTRLYINDGAGNYALDGANDFTGHRSANGELKLVDLNNDNADEIVIDQAFIGNDSLSVFWNDGLGDFSTPVRYEINNTAYVVTVGDVNSDGFKDLFYNGMDENNIWKFQGLINDQLGGLNSVLYGTVHNILEGDVKFFDPDDDGDLDLIATGKNYELGQVTAIYSNDGSNNFDAVATHEIDSLNHSSIAFADIDNNGFEELIISGTDRIGTVVTKLYSNDGVSFSYNAGVSLTPITKGHVEFIHANSDEYWDLLTIGEDQSGVLQALMYINDGSGSFTEISPGIEGLKEVALSQGDVNGDALNDLVLAGNNGDGYIVTSLYFNNGDGTFTKDESNVFIPGYSVQIADLDGDSDGDIYISGSGIQHTYSNDGTGNFELTHYLDEVWRSETQFDDVDLDGDLDFIVSGNWKGKNSGTRTYLYVNDGAGNFTRNTRNMFHDVHSGSIHLADIDGDFDNDVVLSGVVTGNTSATRIYRNITCSTEPYVLDAVTSCESYEFYGQTLNETGTYMHTFTTDDGCSRSLQLDFTSLKDNVVIDVETCDEELFNGELLTSSGQYTASFTNILGCDSLVTLNLTILEPTSSETIIDVCESYEWNGTTYDVSGTYQELFKNSVGCDSTAVLELTILDPTTGEESVEACDLYIWEGSNYDVSGSFTKTLTNSMGCDSLATLNLTILESTEGSDEVSSCDSYEWEGNTYDASGIYSMTLINSVGCDSLATLNLTILESTEGSDEVSSCDSYEWEGSTYNTSGSYSTTLTNSVGCDSLATLNLTILESTEGSDEVSSCDFYEWEGSTYDTSGIYSITLANSVGCDSLATLNLTILESTEGSDEVSSCDFYEWEGSTYYTSGIYSTTLTNSVGCDSLATLNLTILESTEGSDEVSSCDSYEWEGSTYNTSGSYSTTLTNSVGCDSLATLNLTILKSTEGSDEVSSCDIYEWEGSSYNTSGIYSTMLTNSVGCDSLATLNLTILESTEGSDEVSSCDYYEWEGSTYNTSGIYSTTLTNSVGCDSLATLNLTILERTEGSNEVASCDFYEWEGSTYNTSGIYSTTLTNSVGCDSLATLNLTILESTEGSDEVSSCDFYEWEGSTYYSSGSYSTTLINSVGCDSLATLSLTILESTEGLDEVASCESYEWEGSTYLSTGIYTTTLTNLDGCDSLATLNLTILESTEGSDEVSSCDFYEWEGSTYYSSGSYSTTLINSVGCDSLATLSLTILESTEGLDEVASCESYEWEGSTYLSTGIYTTTLTNSVGCDSLATLNLTILESTEGSDEVASCDFYEWEGSTYYSSGDYTKTLINTAGCDSIATLSLTILERTDGLGEAESCDYYEWEETTFYSSGTYTKILTNSVGCDSIASLNLIIHDSSEGSMETEACGSYDWEGSTYEISGAFTKTLTNSVGCDSIATLNLTILESTEGSEIVDACDSYEWEGTLYDISGSYIKTLTNAVGCDSLATLELYIFESSEGEASIEACDSYEWEGTNYTVSGSYIETLTNSVGCDSLATLNLTIHHSDEVSTGLEACGSYEFGTQLLTESGTYVETFTNQVGCDSVVTLALGILPEPSGNIELNGVVLFAEEKSADSYQWYDCDTNEPIEGEDKRQLTPPRSGSYSVEVSNGMCTVVSECMFFGWIVGTNDPFEQQYELYPTKTTGTLFIESNEVLDNVSIDVISMAGVTIYHEDHAQLETAQLDITAKPGMYLVRLISNNQVKFTRRIHITN